MAMVNLPDDLAELLRQEAARREMTIGEVAAELLGAQLSVQGTPDGALGMFLASGRSGRQEPLGIRAVRKDLAARRAAPLTPELAWTFSSTPTSGSQARTKTSHVTSNELSSFGSTEEVSGLPAPVVAETAWIIDHRLGAEAEARFLRLAATEERPPPGDYAR